ncbi:MAG: hypothetical protein ACTSUE_11025 [Promethearchaeota archaeon]
MNPWALDVETITRVDALCLETSRRYTSLMPRCKVHFCLNALPPAERYNNLLLV